MSTKDWILYSVGEANLYQDVSFGGDNHNPAIFEIEGPAGFSVTSETTQMGQTVSKISLEISAERFDKLASAWLKHRKVSPYKYTLQELLDKCEDEELKQLVEDRQDQGEVDMGIDDLSADNKESKCHAL
ncbi:hypothetical protein EYS14_11190 [Alteromonadaceae bacterium M269]|nr:hypothetical protein EYS14_11190 [Alteromonadaceae bacterium M269]